MDVGQHENAEEALQETKSQPIADLAEIHQEIIANYKSHFKTLPVLPLLNDEDEELLQMYQSPTMFSVDRRKNYTQLIECCHSIFCESGKLCDQIYLTGEAGVGKTSFCKYLCYLWCKNVCGDKLSNEYKQFQADFIYISKFQYVFYINLRDTKHSHVLDMIIEQHFNGCMEKYELPIKMILQNRSCLVIMDGLEEWSPNIAGQKDFRVPEKIVDGYCVYIITCRPYVIESVGMSLHKDIDHHIQMRGLTGDSADCYVENVINYMNKQTCTDRKLNDFKQQISKCCLEDQLCVPLIASHLVVLWFEKTLTDMPRAVIYANILEMMFERAKERKVEFPPSPTSALQLPEILSELKYLNEYVTLLYNVCHFSFCSMLKQGDNVPGLVFTRELLQSEPYCFPVEETEFLCTVGLLSKNVGFGCCSVDNSKLSFIHKSYLDFFAAMFVSSFDSSNLFTGVTKRWSCLNDVLPFENLLPMLAGFSNDRIKQLLESVNLQISDDLTKSRRNAIFYSDFYPCCNQISLLHNVVVNCFKEVNKCDEVTVLEMEDFIFMDDYNIDTLRNLLLLNTTSVKSIHSCNGKYYPEFDQTHCLQYLIISEIFSEHFVKFTQCMLQNSSTLHTVCIQGPLINFFNRSLMQELPVRKFHHLTSLSLSSVTVQHDSLHDLMNYLSDNVLLENIKLYCLLCADHRHIDSDCTLTLNLSKHTKLTSLCLYEVDILCDHVNASSLQSIKLHILSQRNVIRFYTDVFNCIKESQITHLDINGHLGHQTGNLSDYITVKTLMSTVKSLPCIKSLKLKSIVLTDTVLLQLHPDVTQVEIKLEFVSMRPQCFHCLINSFVNNKSVIKVNVGWCDLNIIHGDGENHLVLSHQAVRDSVKYMSEYLESISSINITYKNENYGWLFFETAGSA